MNTERGETNRFDVKLVRIDERPVGVMGETAVSLHGPVEELALLELPARTSSKDMALVTGIFMAIVMANRDLPGRKREGTVRLEDTLTCRKAVLTGLGVNLRKVPLLMWHPEEAVGYSQEEKVRVAVYETNLRRFGLWYVLISRKRDGHVLKREFWVG